MRYMLNDNNETFIELSNEITYIKTYIQLQELRLSKDKNPSIKFIIISKERFLKKYF